jgi:type VI secretion system secreted protein VgrG
MPAGLSQDKRIASLTTPLPQKGPGDVLGITRFEGAEGLSELFEYRIEAVSEQENIDFTPAIGRNCHVEFAAAKGKRYFNGVLVEAQWIGMKDHDHAYRLVLRPWLWLLSHSANCRIFRGKNAPDIIKEVFTNAGFSDFDEQGLKEKPYPVMEYCVQYRETDLAFVSRLMEQYGIYYYFVHTREKHTLALADSNTSHGPGDSIPYNPTSDDPYLGEQEHIYHWMPERRFRTGKVALSDYDYFRPDAELLVDEQAPKSYDKSDLEVYDFPGKYPRENRDADKDDRAGKRLAKVRLEAEQALDQRRHAAGDAVSLYPGGMFKLDGHSKKEDQQYLVVRATHSFSTQHYRSGAAADEDRYYGHYEVLPSSRPFRAPLLTPKPVIHGPQTAKVVDRDGKGAKGKDKIGKEIDVDKHGRIHVRFHWDRDKGPSRPVRVAQVWSGKTWGGQFIPRIGMEVVIEFLEGDPDRPLVIGAVYNKDYTYPYALPGLETRSGIKSDTSKHDGGFNELYFEDKAGEELVYLRAEQDHQVLVQRDEKRQIDRNWTVNVGNKVLIEAGNEIVLKVGDSTITMKKTSITLRSTNITVKAAAKTDIYGDVKLILKGGMVEIN